MSGLLTGRWGRVASLLLMVLAAVTGTWSARAYAAPTDPPEPAVMYFFWGEGCPHCAAAKPVLADMASRHPQLVVRDYEIFNSAENRALFAAMADQVGFEASGVPTFVLGDQHWVGFAERTGPELEQAVVGCLATGCADAGAGLVEPVRPPGAPTTGPPAQTAPAQPTPPTQPAPPAAEADVIELPLIGEVDLAKQSLVVTTVLIALVDGFNPCSLWVLTILIAMALRTGSRKLTMLIGLVFIGVSGLVYALFIAGIFSVLTVLTISNWVRILVAVVAGAFAVVNIKDYFFYQRGLSFSIPDKQKPGIYAKTRAVIANTDNVPLMVASTAALAAGVSLIELACTAGFPVVWSNILTAHNLTAGAFVGLLLIYMLIYQLDELLLFSVAVVTLRASKMQEKHGRILKLVSGMLMLCLAIVMIVDPTLMNSVVSSLAVFGAALGATLLVLLAYEVLVPRLRGGQGRATGRRRQAPSPGARSR